MKPFLLVLFLLALVASATVYRFRERVFDSDVAPPEVTEIGVAFANALATGRYEDACKLLTSPLRADWPPAKLKSQFERMTMGGVVTDVEALEAHAKYANRRNDDLGGVYVSISGHALDQPVMTYNEAVLVFVVSQPEGPRIREIIWGRP
jgi:hypothetical protein